MKNNIHRSPCPVSTVLDIFGDKWTLLIIRDIILEEKSLYKEFMQSEEKIATNILANRLNILEDNGYIIKEKAQGGRSKHFYRPTEKIIHLIPLLFEFILCGNTLFEDTYTVPGDLLHRLKTDKISTIQVYSEKLMAGISQQK